MNATNKTYKLRQAIAYRTGIELSYEQAATLRRAEMTLRRWAENKANATIRREGEDGTGKPHRWTCVSSHIGPRDLGAIPDREAGALRRVAKVCEATGLHYYHQGDPRGCSLYVAAQPLTHNTYARGVVCCD